MRSSELGTDEAVSLPALDYFSQPRSVADTLLEIELFGTGPESIKLLESLQGRDMSSAERVEVAGAWERQARWMSTRAAAANLAVVDEQQAGGREADRAHSSRLLELGMVIDAGDAFLRQVKLPQARLLATTLRATRDLIERGDLSDYRGRVICEKLADLAANDPEAARAIEAQVLVNASDLQLKSLADKLRRLVHEARPPQAVLQEFVDGAENREVRVDDEPYEPGLLGLRAKLPAEVALQMKAALEAKAAEFARADKREAAALARAAATDPARAGEALEFRRRNRDQRMADALAWFVLGPDENDESRPARPTFLVQLTMSLPVLLALRAGSAVLPGYGPIPAEIARQWAEDADFQRFVHDPVTGYLLDDGYERYRPRARMRRFTRNRDVTDRFPGSNRSAQRCDGDHVRRWTGDGTGGRTSSANIANTGRVGHIAKTHSGWVVHGDANGVLVWQSPHGRVYRSTPYDYRDPAPTTVTRDPGPPPF